MKTIEEFQTKSNCMFQNNETEITAIIISRTDYKQIQSDAYQAGVDSMKLKPRTEQDREDDVAKEKAKALDWLEKTKSGILPCFGNVPMGGDLPLPFEGWVIRNFCLEPQGETILSAINQARKEQEK